MAKKFNRLINSSIILSLLFAILGTIIIFFPETSLKIIAIMLSITLIINGFYLIIIDIQSQDKLISFDSLPTGILSIVLGIIMISYPNTLTIIIPIILGIWFILSSIFKIRLSLSLKKIENSPWLITMIIAIISILCGIILIANPTISSITITVFSGTMLVVYSISDIIDMILFKKQINNIIKYFKK